MVHRTVVRGLPAWCEPERLLGPGEWTIERLSAHADLATHAAADLDARLRGIGIGGNEVVVECVPPLKRPAVRAARTTDARRRRETTPGFTRAGVRLDAEGRMSLTPEALALAIGERAGGRSVVDAGCGAGGNAIGFARAGCAVTAIERDVGRLADARHNARVYGVADRIRFVHGEVLEVLPGIDADLVFLDPPWGAEWSRRRVDSLPMVQEVLAIGRRTWVKVPPSFDVRTVEDVRPEAWYGLADGDRRRVKFLLLRR